MTSLPLRLMTTRAPRLLSTVATFRNFTMPGFFEMCFDCSDTRLAVPP
jgi:hypothetical protein